MQAAQQYRTAEAIELYTKSFEATPNPSPLINRAKLYRWRLLFAEAVRDLETASRLDKQRDKQFSSSIEPELMICRELGQNLFNGKRNLLVIDLKAKGFDYVAERLADTIFDGDGSMLGYHVMNEIDNVVKFENIDDFPEVKRLLANELQDYRVVDSIVSDPELQRAFAVKDKLFQAIVCVYDYKDMATMRDLMVKKIWKLMNSAH